MFCNQAIHRFMKGAENVPRILPRDAIRVRGEVYNLSCGSQWGLKSGLHDRQLYTLVIPASYLASLQQFNSTGSTSKSN